MAHQDCLKEMPIEISHDNFRHAILSAIAEEMTKIMAFSTLGARSVNAAIKELGISHSSAYRKIKWMVISELIPFTALLLLTRSR